MVCPKCGNTLADGNMYCELCGEEIHIVPDFEPEIENSIIDALSDVVEHIEAEQKQDEVKESNESIYESGDVIVVKKSLVFKAVFFIVALLIGAIVLIGINIYHDNSYSYQIECGDKEYAIGDYDKALEYYERAYRLDDNNIEALKCIGKVYENYDNSDRAEYIYHKIVKQSGDIASVEALLNIYINNQKYNEAYELLKEYGDEKLKEKYNRLLVAEPVFSLEEGTYDEIKYLDLSSPIDGNIYYTLDGAEPGSDCNLFDSSIVLKNGKYEVCAIVVNEYGICSEVVKRTYEIYTDIPDDPLVSLSDGAYEVPQLIRVTVPLNSNVYYTTDGSEPSNVSAIYTDPIAIPLGDSVYKFVAINENGVMSEIVTCKYSLNVDTVVSQDQAIELVKNRQFEIGRVTSIDGSVEGSDGKYMYAYSELRYVQNRTLYFISEYYQEGTIRMVTGNVFAVDVYDGQIYQAVAGSNNSYSLRAF